MPELLHSISIEAHKGRNDCSGWRKTAAEKNNIWKKILSGLIRCRQGGFFIDGKNVKQRKLSDYVYFVMQEADHQLYTDSVTEELRLGNKKIPGIDEKKCLEFLKMLHLEIFQRLSSVCSVRWSKAEVDNSGRNAFRKKPIIVLMSLQVD